MKSVKKMLLIAVIVSVFLSGATTGSLWGGCSASNNCGGWCTTVGDCNGKEYCFGNADHVFCECNGVALYFDCEGYSGITVYEH